MNKQQILDELKSLGVVRCVIEYSGSGDSGQVNNVLAYLSDSSEARRVDDLPDTPNPDVIRAKIKARLLDTTTSVERRMEEFAYDLLDSVGAGDWYNNDGGDGTMTIYVEADPEGEFEAGQIHIEHYTNEITQHEELYTV